MTKYTKGPWSVVLRGERGTFHIPEAQIHEAQHSGDGVDGWTISSANANLISCAPEMAEMLLKVWNNEGYEKFQVRDLLKKAEVIE